MRLIDGSEFSVRKVHSISWSVYVIESIIRLSIKGVVVSDLQFCRAISEKSEPLAIIPKMLICRPSLNLGKSKVKLKFWWLHQSSHSSNRRSLREISKSISSETIYRNLFKSWHNTWNKRTKIRRRAIYISMTEFS